MGIYDGIIDALADGKLEQAAPADPMDWPLPCDVKVGCGTHGKGTALRGLVARMQCLYDAMREKDDRTPSDFAKLIEAVSAQEPICKACNGSGEDGSAVGYPCVTCDGTGESIEGEFSAPVQEAQNAQSVDDDPGEAAYWNFDARKKGYGQWKGAPQTERDAFKTEYRAIYDRQYMNGYQTATEDASRLPVHDSDCAMHNEPAYPNGPCDCSLSRPVREPLTGWISVDERLPEIGVTVMVYTPPTEDDWPGSVNIQFDCLDPDSDGELWLSWWNHYEHFICVAPAGSSGPKSDRAPYTLWAPIPALPDSNAAKEAT